MAAFIKYDQQQRISVRNFKRSLPGLSAILLFLSLLQPVHAQQNHQHRIDSMLLELPTKPEDSNKVKLLNDLAYLYVYVNPEEGLKHGFKSLELSKKLSWAMGVAKANTVIGSNYANKADYANALKYEFEALKYYEQTKDLPNQANLLRNLGVVFYRSKNKTKALEFYDRSINIYQSLRDSTGMAGIYNNIANVYYSMRDMDKVLEYNLKALDLYQQINNIEGVARMLGNIGNFYAETGEFNNAMPYYFDALEKEKAINNKNGVVRNMGNIGQTYLDIANAGGTVHPDKYIPKGKKANLQKAIEYLTITVQDAKEMKQTEFQLAFQEVLSDAYRMAGDPEKALEIYKEYILIRDSIYDVEKYNEATRRELDYEYGKREDSIEFEKRLSDVKFTEERKSRTREKIYFGVGFLIVLIFSVFLYNRWQVTRKQKAIIEHEKKRSDDLLLNILPEETAEELKATGTTTAKHFDDVTVMFTDFKNFTTMSENLSAQELVNEINYCYSAFDNIITKYDIEKIKTIGDSYMCAAGLPVTDPMHAINAVNAALEIRNFIETEKENRIKNGFPYFEIRIGLHSGPVVAGTVGLKKFAYDIWGDTVNIAARMESSGDPGKVNISGATYDKVKDNFSCEHRGKIEAKNKGQVDMYFVERK